MKDCPDCWYENLNDKALCCESCGFKFVELIHNDEDWEVCTEEI